MRANNVAGSRLTMERLEERDREEASPSVSNSAAAF